MKVKEPDRAVHYVACKKLLAFEVPFSLCLCQCVCPYWFSCHEYISGPC